MKLKTERLELRLRQESDAERDRFLTDKESVEDHEGSK